MSTLLLEILAGLVRVALGGVIAWLLERGIIQPNQVDQLVAGIATAILTVAWVVWAKVRERKEKLAALVAEAGATLNEAKAMVKEGKAPSALTPDNTPPRPKS